MSIELDICPVPFNEVAAATIDGNIGELTRFHDAFRVYAHGVSPETATLPEDFRRRLVELEIGGARVHCLAPIDLAYSKLAAGREKDLEFVRGLLEHKLIRQVDIGRLIASTPDLNVRRNIEDRLTVVLAKLKHKREEQRGRGRGMSM